LLPRRGNWRLFPQFQTAGFRCLGGPDECSTARAALVADVVEISAPTCSKQVTVLEEAGYVTVRKGAVGRRPRTWLSLTSAGREALTSYLATLRAIAGAAFSPAIDHAER
jgi:DNA-binding MarR family transcriptional regulator